MVVVIVLVLVLVLVLVVVVVVACWSTGIDPCRTVVAARQNTRNT